MSTAAAAYQLLEINVISAQDLAEVSKSVRAYAVAWVDPDRKLATQVDNEGHTNPTWNEKFVFRLHHSFLNSVIMIEIYSHAWLRHLHIGTVAVLVSNLLPPYRKPKLRFVGLQIHRPSGRPQGILNIGVTLLDTTMRSMPLYSELSSSAVGFWDPLQSNKTKNTHHSPSPSPSPSPLDSTLFTLQRCQSENNDSTINDYAYSGNAKHYGYDEHDSDVGLRKGGVFNEDSLISDVGPSPSVVAAAIAKGLYPMPQPGPRTADSSTIDGWSENSGTEGMKRKMEKWRTELTPAAYEGERNLRQTSQRVRQTPRQRARRGGPCSCFGSVFGVEISITCGGRKGHGGGKGGLTTASSEVTYDESYV